jgi:hypothetical protein
MGVDVRVGIGDSDMVRAVRAAVCHAMGLEEDLYVARN